MSIRKSEARRVKYRRRGKNDKRRTVKKKMTQDEKQKLEMKSLVHEEYHELIDSYNGDVKMTDDNSYRIYPQFNSREYLFKINKKGDIEIVGDTMSILVNSKFKDSKERWHGNQYWKEIGIPEEKVRKIVDEFWNWVQEKENETGFNIGYSHSSGDMFDFFNIIIEHDDQSEGDIDNIKEIINELARKEDKHNAVLESYQ